MIENLQNLCKKIFELACRVTIGSVFIESGLGKLHNLEKVTEFFQSLNIPYPAIQAPFVSAVELICGFCILVGLFTRLSAVPLIGTMVVALLTARIEEITDFSALTGMSEYLYILILLGFVAYGSQTLSIDHARKTKKVF